eukprot:TRINITY_DN27724_c0_g1_i1.p1 TRINITY_DN27724_c0_g1~~TRINITY_DN27724_c0_g1_i1.p1  ORF type:complete len:542 (+),score=55.73 TRINITY_DN27724_c0_g1_i1:151-1776(+)
MLISNRPEYSRGEEDEEWDKDEEDATSSDSENSAQDVREIGRGIGSAAFLTTCCQSMFGSEQRSPGHLEALGFFRFFAAVHIFAFHFWNVMGAFHADFHGELPAGQLPISWARSIRLWGSAWVTFFFVLSGFTLTYSQLKRTDPTDMPHFCSFMWRRWISIYPLYAIYLLLKGPGAFDGPADTFTGKLILGHGFTTQEWSGWLAHVLLVQSWTDGLFGGSFPSLYEFDPSWFLSNLQLMWILWYAAFPRIQRLSQECTWRILGVLLLIHSIIPLLIYAYCGGILPLWAKSIFRWPSDFSPLKNIWKFCCGVLLAKLFMVERDHPTPERSHSEPYASSDAASCSQEPGLASSSALPAPTSLQLIATGQAPPNVWTYDREHGSREPSASDADEECSTASTTTRRQPCYTAYYGSIGWMVLLSAFVFGGQELSDLAGVGGFMPVTLLLVWGLANGEEDLLAWCIGRRPFCWGDILAYGIYILHPCIWAFLVPMSKTLHPRLFSELTAMPIKGFMVLLAMLLVFVAIAEYGFARPVQGFLKGHGP